MLKKNFLLSTVIALALIFMPPLFTSFCELTAADIVVVANKKLPADSLSKDALKAIYLGQKGTLDNGAGIEIVILKDSDIHNDFLQRYVNKTAAQFSNYWKQQVFTGKGKMPRQFDSESSLLEYVAGRDGAIGYCSGNADTNKIKIISIH